MKRIIKIIQSNVNRYVQVTSAAIAIAFAIMAPVMVGSVGMALDFSRAYLVQQRLHQAIDAAALAAAATSSDEDGMEQRLLGFFEINYPPEEIGITFDPQVVITGSEISVVGTAQYPTFFLRIWGINEIDVSAKTVVLREVQGLEVVMVMDNTGSMSSNNNIGTLRTAAENFVNILFDSTSDPTFIKVGLVPYSTSVNVGSYGLGIHPDGSNYGTPFVNNPHDVDYDANYNSSRYDTDWMGCVLAHDYPDDTLDHEGPWEMYRYCRDEDDDPVCDYNWSNHMWQYWPKKSPNYICPRTSIMPLSSDRDALNDQIETMYASGHTYGNYGMVWGGRVLSPEFPFEEAEPWDDIEWRKAIVMMTDGINTMNSNYSLYGPTNDHNIDAGDLNDRFADVCEDLKSKGVIIYTVTFAGGVNGSTKDFYRDCASTEDQYYDAPSQFDLIDVFETISRELSNLHIQS